MMMAAIRDHVSIVETLIAFGAKIDDERVAVKMSALMWSAQNGRVFVVRLLLSLNADTTTTDFGGRNALDLANTIEIKQLFADHEKKSVIDTI